MIDYTDRPEPRPCLEESDCTDFALAGTDQCLRHAKSVDDAEQLAEERYHGSLPTRPAEGAQWHEPDQIPARAYDDEEPTAIPLASRRTVGFDEPPRRGWLARVIERLTA